jgi:hypothetical protein
MELVTASPKAMHRVMREKAITLHDRIAAGMLCQLLEHQRLRSTMTRKITPSSRLPFSLSSFISWFFFFRLFFNQLGLKTKMPIFHLNEVMNDFGFKLIEAMNSKIIRNKIFPNGTVKQVLRVPTGWGDAEVRFQVVSGAGDASLREVSVRQRMGMQFFEVRFTQRTTGKGASRFYSKAIEESLAILDMMDYLVTGHLTQNFTRGAEDYANWLDGDADDQELLSAVVHSGFFPNDFSVSEKMGLLVA